MVRPRIGESIDSIQARQERAREAKAKLDAGGQLELEDIADLEPADVTAAMAAGQLTDLGCGPRRRSRRFG